MLPFAEAFALLKAESFRSKDVCFTFTAQLNGGRELRSGEGFNGNI
jgi:hypothetical protein